MVRLGLAHLKVLKTDEADVVEELASAAACYSSWLMPKRTADALGVASGSPNPSAIVITDNQDAGIGKGSA